MNEPIVRLGMVGGGIGSLIGPVHRRAAELDGRIRLVAGAFSRDAEGSRRAGEAYGIDPNRVYPDYRTMFTQEAARADGIDMVVIVTPNDTHFEIARDALGAGLDVISDKPATAHLHQAIELADIVRSSRRRYALTYTYTGYPMLREARALIASGTLGAVRKVAVEYYQGWLSAPVEQSGNRQAEWRTDPARSGIGGCIADIGVHAFNLAEFVTGQRVTHINAELDRVVPSRLLDDDATVLVRMDGGARGIIAASQIATGERNGLSIRVWGEKGGLTWGHEQPDRLLFNRADGVTETHHAGNDKLSPIARAASRLPSGHPEGFIEALANIYVDFISSSVAGGVQPPLQGIAEGVRSLAFVDAAVAHMNGEVRWTKLSELQL